MDRNDLPPTSWRPCDIANGHRLGTDGVWRPVLPPKQSWYARTTGILAIIFGTLTFLTVCYVLALSNGTVSHEATGTTTVAPSEPVTFDEAIPTIPTEEPEPLSDDPSCHDLNQQLWEIRARNTEGGFIQGMDQWSSDDVDTWHSTMGDIIDMPGCDLETR